MEAKKFFNGGCGTTVRASQVFNQTTYVTIFDLPPGLLVEVIFVPKWKIKVIVKLVTIFIDRICPEDKPKYPWPTKQSNLNGPTDSKPDRPISKPDKPRSSSSDTPPRGILVKPGDSGRPTIDRPIFTKPGKPIGIIGSGDKPSKPNGGRPGGRGPGGRVASGAKLVR
jgi:hypothetical protein